MSIAWWSALDGGEEKPPPIPPPPIPPPPSPQAHSGAAGARLRVSTDFLGRRAPLAGVDGASAAKGDAAGREKGEALRREGQGVGWVWLVCGACGV